MSRSPVPVCLAVVLAVWAGVPGLVGVAQTPSPPAVLLLETVRGAIEIEVYPNDAPKSLAHIMALVQRNFYRGQRVHWVQPGVIQFGDPQTRDMTKADQWGTGGSGRTIGVAEPSKRPFVRGSVGVAYQPNRVPESADSQIFILRAPNPALNGKYASLGRVTRGLDVLDKIQKGDIIKSLTVK